MAVEQAVPWLLLSRLFFKTEATFPATLEGPDHLVPFKPNPSPVYQCTWHNFSWHQYPFLRPVVTVPGFSDLKAGSAQKTSSVHSVA